MKAFTLLTLVSPIVAVAIKGSAVGKAVDSVDASLMERDDVTVLCGQPPDHPDTPILASEYAYPVGLLLGAGDKTLHFSKGPSACRQVACNPSTGEDAGVTVCSDESVEIDILYTDMAWFAQRVYDQCKVRHSDGKDYITKGQAFNPSAKWNVILSSFGVNNCHNYEIDSQV
ncbi:hypothetical protein F4818DRAFT_440822 [Hypoxylon cercidicola]|nr:hypothetical protein F4818DRAFT_440822 [Hypoxylon cercidicola]